MSIDSNLDALRQQWQKASVEPDNAKLALELEKRVMRQTRWLKFGLIAPILVTLVIGGALLLNALRSAQTADIVLAAEGWLFILVMWTVMLWISRGTWRAYRETTAAFLELSIRRCRANLAGVRFGVWIYACQFFIVLLWKFQYASASLGTVLTAWPVILIGGIGFPAMLVWAVWYARKQRRELDYLLDLQRQLINE